MVSSKCPPPESSRCGQLLCVAGTHCNMPPHTGLSILNMPNCLVYVLICLPPTFSNLSARPLHTDSNTIPAYLLQVPDE